MKPIHAERFHENPLIRPKDVRPSASDLEVACVLNPGAFVYQNRIGLLLRVAERPRSEADCITTCVCDPPAQGGVRRIRYRKDDPKLSCTDPRVLSYDGEPLLTTLSHLRLAWSEDGRHFVVDDQPTLIGQTSHENYGLEDCRVTWLEDLYHLTFTAVSQVGVAVGMMTTGDWKHFDRKGLILPPHNKDCALFPRRIADQYWCVHRPSGQGLGGHFIWTAQSPDTQHWGEHHCLARTRPGMWDSRRIGANGPPIETPQGWLLLYHGADEQSRYCLGAMLLDLDNPRRVLARSQAPIFQPQETYETQGFFGQVVFSNGHVVQGDDLLLYYGAADEVICGAVLKISELLAMLRPGMSPVESCR